MSTTRFDRISKAFARRHLSRRQTLATGAAGLAAMAGAATDVARPVAAQDATSALNPPPLEADHGPTLLFVQTYQSGTVTPIEGIEGRYTLTLEASTGQTIYFSDRPDRIVGATDTPEFLEGLGFSADNPPNAALVVETAPGVTDVAVVELFSPVYDAATGGVIYEAAPLANWQAELGVGLQETPADLAALAPSFGAAHLFIDGLYDCPDGDIVCQHPGWEEPVVGTIPSKWFGNFCSSYFDWQGRVPGSSAKLCVPCTTPERLLSNLTKVADVEDVWRFWGQRCNEMFPACGGICRPSGWCHGDPLLKSVCPTFA